MQTVTKTPWRMRGCHGGQLPMSTVRTRFTASLTSPSIIGTRWNASLPQDTFGARKFAGSAGDARRFTKQTNKERK